jgi:hypothetical protein
MPTFFYVYLTQCHYITNCHRRIETITITVWNDGDKSAFTTVNNLNNVAIETTLASVLIKAVVKAGEPS